MSHVPAPPWHVFGGGQTTAAPAWQLPFWHVSPVVHAFRSLHVVPFGFGNDTHCPVLGSQLGGSKHGASAPLGWHKTLLDPMQTPPEHVSTVVHALPSLQAAPSGFAGFEHCPVAGSQVPAVWHVSVAMQMVSPPVHAPLSHRSPVVHALPSSHAVPVGFAGLEQPVTGSHTPAS
jgi:hypothetical protein